MFFRASKSIVKSLTSCQIHSDGKNFKIAGEISQILSKLSKNSTRLNALSLDDVAAVNKLLPNRNGIYNFYDNQLSRRPMKKSCSPEINQSIARKTNDNNNFNFSNHQEDNGRSQIEKLVEALYHLPIAEKVLILNSPLMPSQKIISKASNVCSRMRPCARILNEMDHSSMKTWQRDYSTAVICKWFPDLMCPPFHEHDVNFILQVKIYRSIEKRNVNNSSWNVSIAKKNNHQMSPISLLNCNRKLAKGLMRKFRNTLPNLETRGRAEKSTNCWVIPAALLNNKAKLLYELLYNHVKCSSFLLNSMNHKDKNNITNNEAVAFNGNGKKTMRSNTLNVIEKENWIQQIFITIKSIFTDMFSKIQSYSTVTSDLYCLENTFMANGRIPVSDIISNNIIFFASKDCESKLSIREKIQALCAQKKESLKKKIERDDICKKRERSCVTSEKKCQKREKICGKQEVNCSKGGKRSCEEQKIISCKRRKNSEKDVCDCHKTRKVVKSQKDQQKKHDTCRIKEDLCQKQHYTEREQTSRWEKNSCKKEKEEEIKEPDCSKIKKVKSCEKKEKNDTSKIKENLCKKEQVQQQEDLCKKEKKEKKEEKPDCSEIKKIEKKYEKKECPPVKRAPPCSENGEGKQKKGC